MSMGIQQQVGRQFNAGIGGKTGSIVTEFKDKDGSYLAGEGPNTGRSLKDAVSVKGHANEPQIVEALQVKVNKLGEKEILEIGTSEDEGVKLEGLGVVIGTEAVKFVKTDYVTDAVDKL